MNNEIVLLRRIEELEKLIKRQPEVAPQLIPLATPLTSTSWDGDAKTTANSGTIDLSSVFSAPAGIKAVSVHFATTSAVVGRISALGTVITFDVLKMLGQVANVENSISGVIACDANGDINFYCSGDLTSVKIRILGYWI
jgi:hypothetical protein